MAPVIIRFAIYGDGDNPVTGWTWIKFSINVTPGMLINTGIGVAAGGAVGYAVKLNLYGGIPINGDGKNMVINVWKNNSYFINLLAIYLSIGIINEKPTAFFLYSIWLFLIGVSLFTSNDVLLKIVAPDYPVQTYKPIQAKIFVVCAVVLLILGFIEKLF